MSATLLQLRRSGIGATDASAVLGLNPWRTPLQVWAEKRGEAPPVEQTDAMLWGTILEPVVAARYGEVTGRVLWAPEQVIHHPRHDMLLCSPDRFVMGEQRGLECKTANAFAAHEWGPAGTDEVPQHYLIQCLHCMLVTGYAAWDLAVLIGGSDFRIYHIRRDEALLGALCSKLVAWWQRHMVEGVEPAAMRGDVEWLPLRYRDHDDVLLPAGVEDALLAAEYKRASADERDATERKESAKARLMQAIGDHDGLQGEGWRVTWRRTVDRDVTDWQALARALSDGDAIAAALPAHTTTKPGTRVFRLSEKDAKP